MESRVSTAGIIVIGDEILKGHVHDINSHYLAKELWSLGIRVVKISVVGDGVDAISQEVKTFSGLYDYVLTSGGIGPTHDDVTMEGIAKSFGEELYTNPDLIKLLRKDGVPDEENLWLRMAIVPRSAVVCPQNISLCPLVRIHNVYPFAGMPSALRSTFQYHKNIFASKEKTAFFLKEVFFVVPEDDLAVPLDDLQNEFKDSVQVGSYPNDDCSVSYQVKVALEGLDVNLVEKSYSSLLLKMGPDSIQSVSNSWSNKEEEKSRESLQWLEAELSSNALHMAPHSLLVRIEDTVNTIGGAFEKFGPEGLCVAFTGGKDCTVLLPLCLAVMKSKGLSSKRLKALYVAPKNSFAEVEAFIEQSVKRYILELIRIEGTIQEALGTLKESHPSISAVLMGTRSTDPYSGNNNLKVFSSTDADWPQYTRVHCILDWSYTQVWLFLRLFQIPYCQLYDQGYTSLGSNTDTTPNPALSNECIHDNVTCNGVSGYRPAYCLVDETLERAGRTKN